MKKLSGLMFAMVGLIFYVFVPARVDAQNAPSQGTTAHLLVTVEARHGSDIPEITRRDVMVHEGHDRDEVTNWIPAQGDNAALELFILLDDESNASLGTQLDELRKFIESQPPSTKVGVAYMQNGIGKIQQNLTSDHALAAQSLRLPMGIGGVNGSPYFSLSDLVKRWPASAARREVLMITDGIDRYYGSGDLDDPYLSAAIDDAQRAGIVVFGIYTPSVGHFGHSYWQTYWGQLYLSKLADQTGGEAYYIGFNGPPVTFKPYLEDLDRHLSHQYLLEFVPKLEKKSGWRKVKISTEVPNAELVSPDKVYVQAAER